MYIDIEEDTRKFRISNLEYVFELNIGTGGGRIHALIRVYTRWAGEEGKNSCWTAGQLDRYSFPGRAKSSRANRIVVQE